VSKRLIDLGLVALLAAAILFAFRDALWALVGLWTRNPMYSYAFTVPIISLYLLWDRRRAFAALSPRPARHAACAVLTLSALMFLAGRLASVQVVEQLAFLVSIVGVVLALFGGEYLRVGWAGIAYLLLMVPVWDGLTEPLHPLFQEQSAAIGAQLLALFGVPVHREGIYLTLPNIIIEVARSCSGVNYLVAVLALGLPLAYLSLPGTWRRVTLITAAMIVAALSNGLRVALISLLAHLEVGSPLHGPMHVLHGLFVAFVGYVAIFGGVRLLSPRHQAPARTGGARPGGRFPNLPAVPVMVLSAVFVVIGIAPLMRVTHAVTLAAGLDSLPLRLGGWTGALASGDDVPWWSGADDQLRRRYVNPEGRAVDVFVAYFRSQHQNKEVTNYRSAALHRQALRVLVPLPNGSVLPTNIIPSPDRDSARLFWYEIDGRVETSQRNAKLWTLWNAVRHGRSNAAVVMLSYVSSTDEAAETMSRDLNELAVLIHEGLGHVLPAGVTAGRRPVAATIVN
jgi:EpsI family protein